MTGKLPSFVPPHIRDGLLIGERHALGHTYLLRRRAELSAAERRSEGRRRSIATLRVLDLSPLEGILTAEDHACLELVRRVRASRHAIRLGDAAATDDGKGTT